MLPTISRLLAVVLVVTVGYHSIDGSPFGWHPLLMAAFIALISEGVAAARNYKAAPSRSRLRLHYVLILLSALALVLGFGFIYYNKNLLQKPHFATWHGLFGVVAVLSIAGKNYPPQFLVLYSFTMPLNSCNCGTTGQAAGSWVVHTVAPAGWARANFWPVHPIFGRINFALGASVLASGLLSGWAFRALASPVHYFVLGTAASLCVIAAYRMLAPLPQRKSSNNISEKQKEKGY